MARKKSQAPAGTPDQFTASGKVKTARGGARNRGGGLVAPGRRARGSAARGTGLAAPQRVINVGGASSSGGGGGLSARGGSRRRGGSSGADNARSSGTGRGGRGKRSAPKTVARGSAVSARRANAIRELVRRGTTPGERAAARGAARRLGI